jgi:hypothetical protein
VGNIQLVLLDLDELGLDATDSDRELALYKFNPEKVE